MVARNAAMGLTVDFTVVPTTGTTLTPIEFTSYAASGAEPYSYVWDFGNGNTATDANPVYTYPAAGLFTVTLCVTDADSEEVCNTKTDLMDIEAATTYTLPVKMGGLRIATFNTSMFRDSAGGLAADLASGTDVQIQWVAESNTGISSGEDFNNDGDTTDPEDAFGYGVFPGQYGMLLLSRFPIDTDNVRTFRNFLWKEMPGNVMPAGYYSPAAEDIFRLSSKSHWDVPIEVSGQTVHVLCSHPTPPVFDGPEDRNGRRNHDEIRFWADYVTPGQDGYIYDDNYNYGGLGRGHAFRHPMRPECRFGRGRQL